MIDAVIGRIESEVPDATAVLAAEDLDALGKGTAPRAGTVYVIPYRERAEPNEQATGAFRQFVLVQILVAFVVRRHDDSKGGKRVAGFDTFKGAIEHALCGWSIEPRNEPFELVAGQAAPLGNGVTVYVQTWQTSRYLEA